MSGCRAFGGAASSPCGPKVPAPTVGVLRSCSKGNTDPSFMTHEAALKGVLLFTMENITRARALFQRFQLSTSVRMLVANS